MRTWVDLSDLVRFSAGMAPATGVQRVVADVAPLLGADPVIYDPVRGRWVLMGTSEREILLEGGLRPTSRFSRAEVADAATACLARRADMPIAPLQPGDVLVELGSPWINQGVLLAVERAQAQGVSLVAYVHDCTPVHEAGHGLQVTTAFRRFLACLGRGNGRMLTYSQSTLDDVQSYCRPQGWPVLPGVATGLPPGLTPASAPSRDESVWSRPYVLFVGTIEHRKNHLVALRAWQDLARLGDSRPDLVCVGRWGWGSDEFRSAWEETGGAASGVHILDQGVGDIELAALYDQCVGTIYPSRMEGWGLPVSESLAFGKVAITTNISSLPEAGQGLAVLIPPDDPRALSAAIERYICDGDARGDLETHIANGYKPVTWRQVADVITEEIRQAGAMTARELPAEDMKVGHEYVLGTLAPVTDASVVRLEAMADDRGTPLLGLPAESSNIIATDALLTGEFAEPTTWGYPLTVGASADLRFRAPGSGSWVVLIASAPIVGSGTIDVQVNQAQPRRMALAYGEVISVHADTTPDNDVVHVHLEVIAQDKSGGLPLTLQSVVLLPADDPQAQIKILERVAQSRSVQLVEATHEVGALRAQLDGVLNSRSWRVTAPLRKLTGDER